MLEDGIEPRRPSDKVKSRGVVSQWLLEMHYSATNAHSTLADSFMMAKLRGMTFLFITLSILSISIILRIQFKSEDSSATLCIF